MTTPQWAPAEILDIDPHSSNFTCIGYAKSKNRRCRNPIACDNRQKGANILLEMSRLDPQSQRLDGKLEGLASRLLCKRWHQDQAAQMKRQWLHEIENYRAAETARREEPGRTANNEPNGEESGQQTIQDPDTSNQQEAVLQEPNHQENSSSTTSSSDERTTPAPDGPIREQPVTPRIEVANEGESEEHVLEPPTQQQPQEQPLHTHDRRPIEGDCSICYEDLNSDTPTVWCRAQCRQNIHADCIDLWHASLEAEDRRKICPCW